MRKKIIVLGAGLVGKAMAIDLAKNFDVTSVDVSEQALAEVQKQSLLIVTHDNEFAENMHRIIEMEDGKIIRQ